MKKIILYLLVILTLNLVSCAKDVNPSDVISSDTEEEIVLFESTVYGSSVSYNGWNEVIERNAIIAECEIIERLPSVLVGYSDSELARIDEYIKTDPRKASYIVLNIRTPIKVKVNKIFYSEYSDIREGDIITVDEPGGNYKGIKLNNDGLTKLSKGKNNILVINKQTVDNSTRYYLKDNSQLYFEVDGTAKNYITAAKENNVLTNGITSRDSLASAISAAQVMAENSAE